MQALLVTHASRPFVEARASLNALENRFSAQGRLANLPPFNSLHSIHKAVQFSGMLTLWDIDKVAEKAPTIIGEYDPGYKIQSAAFHGDQLLVLGEDRIEVLSPGFRLEKTIEDPWLVGGHTIYCDDHGFAYATSAPANAVLKIDIEAGKVVERIRLPDRYGSGYTLAENDDLGLHFVPTDLQPTHINSAVPCAEGLLVTLWIQGAVGVIGPAGQFREIVCGYRGCHGGRIEVGTGLLYFTDSPAGIVWFADYKTGQIMSRIKVNSAWAHDADQVGENIFAVALSDHNRVEMVNRVDGAIIAAIDCHPFGASAMFVKATALPDAWRAKIQDVPMADKVSNIQQASVGEELLSEPLNPINWIEFAAVPVCISSSLHIDSDKVQYEYLAEGITLTLPPGEYIFDAQLVCKAGEAAVGILDETEAWIAILIFDSSNSIRSTHFSIHAPSSVTLVITGHNARRACPVTVELQYLSLKRLITGLDDTLPSTAGSMAVSKVVSYSRTEVDHLQAEINDRDALLKKTLDQLQVEINKRDALLKETHDYLQAEINDRDALLKKTHDQLQVEINKRDALLKETHDHLQAEINDRDALLKKTHDQLQVEINKRDALLKETHDHLQAEINDRDALLKKTHDHLQAEINKRDEILIKLQKQLNERF